MRSQTFLFFEQEILDAEQTALDVKRAAKEAAAKARADAKEKEEREKSTRRLMREAEYRRKHPPGHAQCGINWTTIREANVIPRAPILWRAWEANPAGSGWTHCHKCGQALIYTTDRDAKPQVCPGHR